MESVDWKSVIGDIVIPIAIYLAGIFTGKAIEKRANAKVNGNRNTVIQNSRVDRK